MATQIVAEFLEPDNTPAQGEVTILTQLEAD
jgi:hypothetical protein